MLLANGKEMKTCFEELAVPLAKTHKRENGKGYWAIEEYRKRMDDVFGPYGYSMEYSTCSPFVFPVYNQVLFTCHCTILIYGENGNVVYKTMGVGCKEIMRLSKTYKEDGIYKTRNEEDRLFTELNNSSYSLQLSAFKNACKSMNIFGCNSEDAAGESSYDKNSYSSSNYRSSDDEGDTIAFYVPNKMKETRKDNNTGKPVYEVKAYRMVGDASYDNKEECTIIFYPNNYMKCENTFNAMLKKDVPYKQSFVVKKGSQGGYIFRGFGGSR